MTISDTGPLYYLDQVEQLSLLPQLLGPIIYVPQAVLKELEVGRKNGLAMFEPADKEWLEPRAVKIPELLRLIDDLGPGESEALALALENPGTITILDDGFARRVAINNGIAVVGTAGLLLKAKAAGFLEAVKSILDEMLDLGFRLHPQDCASSAKRRVTPRKS